MFNYWFQNGDQSSMTLSLICPALHTISSPLPQIKIPPLPTFSQLLVFMFLCEVLQTLEIFLDRLIIFVQHYFYVDRQFFLIWIKTHFTK